MFAVDNLTTGVFASLPPANIQSLLAKFIRMPVKRGDQIIKQGEPGDYYYLIESGRCKVSRQVAGSSLQLAELKAKAMHLARRPLVADTAQKCNSSHEDRWGSVASVERRFQRALARTAAAEGRWPERLDAGLQTVPPGLMCDSRPNIAAMAFKAHLNIPLDDIRQALAALDPEKEYIVYCQTGRRSSAAAFLLSQRGFNAALLDGGMRAYANAMESVQ
jgi:rhodanese-related sulfurtransferase